MHEVTIIAGSREGLMHAALPYVTREAVSATRAVTSISVSATRAVTSRSQWSNFTVAPGPPF